MSIQTHRCGWLTFLVLISVSMAHGQNSAPSSPASAPTADNGNNLQSPKMHLENPYVLQPGEDPDNHLISPFLKHLANDQKQFWTAPTRLKVEDLHWIVPFAGMTAAFIASDSWWSKQVNPSHAQTSLHVSDYGAYSLIGLGGTSFILGHITNNDHLQEAGLLSGEAAVNATAVAYLIKEVTQRQRPIQGDGNGNFFTGGASFPSEHSAIAWSIASIWAHEYPSTLSQIAAYGLASTITATRVTARQHFPSDVIVGSALGWYFGRQVYRAHHDPELGGSGWGNLLTDKANDQTRNPNNMASPYIPLDSWIYPAFERLIALGYIQSATLDIRPWTRLECARMLEEAGDKIANEDSTDEAVRYYRDLATEFRAESNRLDGGRNLGAQVESVYTRVMDISGPPLRDGYHFAQTIADDFGRPFGEGVNLISGASASAVVGPLAFYVRGEYQEAPSINPIPASTFQAMANADFVSDFPLPFMPAGYASSFYTGSYSRFTLLEGAVSLTLHNVQMSFGKQSAWLGPGEAGPLQFSDNAAPIPMFKIEDVAPYHFPLLSSILGPAHTEFFLGELSGLHFVYQMPVLYGPNNVNPQPFVHGDRITFHPTSNFEIGMGFVAMFGGPGLPFTFKEFLKTYYSHKSNLAQNPGKRFSAADFRYRVPGLRNWLTVYLDSLVVDEYSPIGSTRPSLNPGLYMPQVPKFPKLELRAEGLKTDQAVASCCIAGNTYFDSRYISGFTNDGYLLGNWIGRAGWGGQAWATYNFSPRSMIQLSYRAQRVDRDFLEGGNLNDFSVKTNLTVHHQLTVSNLLQYERWNFPVLSTLPHSNFAASVQLTYWPNWGLH